MRYIPLTKGDQEAMLREVGVDSVDALFSQIPASIRKKNPPAIPPARSEAELVRFFSSLALKNQAAAQSGWMSFLGAGAYEHFIPTAVDAISMRGEFATAYTPYQPEVSQGTLQAIFEFQSMVASLTGMEIANASMYDGASALAEAVLMALRIRKGSHIWISKGVHPEYRKTIESYLSSSAVECTLLEVDEQGQTIIPDDAGEGVSAIVCAQPNFYGVIENLDRIATAAKEKGMVSVVTSTEPLAFGLIHPPGHFGVDIVAGEAQSFGNPLSFGGPYVGFFATRKQYLRQMPGRLVGQTVDQEGKRGYVLTLSTREQHIRREKATSNICTNHSLCALRACIHLSLLGRDGLRALAKTNTENAHRLFSKLLEINGVSAVYSGPFFNEFVLRLPVSTESFLANMEKEKILAGVAMHRFESERTHDLLLAVTETKTDADLDRFVDAARKAL